METTEHRTSYEGICKQCGIRPVAEGSSTPLCEECRELYIKRPMPFYIKLFLVFIIAAIGYSAWQLPTVIKYNVAYQQGRNFEAERKYMSAQKAYQMAQEHYPDSIKIRYGLIKCNYYNTDNDALYKNLEYMEGRTIDEGPMYDELQRIYDETAALHIPNEEISNNYDMIVELSLEEKIQYLEEFLKKNPVESDYSRYELANLYMTAKRYEASENMILKLRKKYPLNAMITIQHMDVYISQGRYDEATRIGRSLLQINHEDIIAYLRLTGIELDQEKYESALDYVEQAMAIDADDTYVMAVKNISPSLSWANK